MDTGTGHIWDSEELKTVDIKGKVVYWKVGEEVEVKGCRFTVEKIDIFPYDTITLKGKSKLDDLMPPKEYQEKENTFLDGIRNMKK